MSDLCSKESNYSHRLNQRKKQILIGKRTKGYNLYSQCIPKTQRNIELKDSWHPVTPDVSLSNSCRSFASDVKHWKKSLHLWSNLSSTCYEAILRNPTLNPVISIQKTLATEKKKNTSSTQFKNCSRSYVDLVKKTCVTPLSNKLMNHSFDKSRMFVNACISTLISSYLCKFLSANNSAINNNNKSYASSIFLDKMNVKFVWSELFENPELPFGFLPKYFSGIQLWPSCFFIQEVDFKSCVIDSPNNVFYTKLMEIQNSPSILFGCISSCHILSSEDSIEIFHLNSRDISNEDLRGTFSLSERLKLLVKNRNIQVRIGDPNVKYCSLLLDNSETDFNEVNTTHSPFIGFRYSYLTSSMYSKRSRF